MSLPLISVIIPIYNRENYIRECLESIINQTYANIEIIIIDDGSTDSSAQICNEYLRKDSRIKYFYQPNAGVSVARNTGLAMATGQWIAWVDSDDFIDKEMFKLMIEYALEQQCDMLRCELFVLKNGKYVVESTYNRSFTGDKDLFIPDILSDKLHSYLCTTIGRKEIYQDIEFPVGKIYEDLSVMYLLLERSLSIGYLHRPLYYYRVLEDGICKSKAIDGEGEYFEALLGKHLYATTHFPNIASLTLSRAAKHALRTIRRYGVDKGYIQIQIMLDFLSTHRNFLLRHCKEFNIYYKIWLLNTLKNR